MNGSQGGSDEVIANAGYASARVGRLYQVSDPDTLANDTNLGSGGTRDGEQGLWVPGGL